MSRDLQRPDLGAGSGGAGALVHAPEAYDAIAADILRLQEPAFRDNVIALGLKNARGYSSERLMRGYETVYRRI